jgi:hypothetical protein
MQDFKQKKKRLFSGWFLAQLIFTLKMEATFFSETSVDVQRITRRYIPEDGTLFNLLCESLKSCIFTDLFYNLFGNILSSPQIIYHL